MARTQRSIRSVRGVTDPVSNRLRVGVEALREAQVRLEGLLNRVVSGGVALRRRSVSFVTDIVRSSRRVVVRRFVRAGASASRGVEHLLHRFNLVSLGDVTELKAELDRLNHRLARIEKTRKPQHA